MVNPEEKYLRFIEHCSKKKYHPTEYLERHHIVPKHEGGSDSPSNIIKLSLKDHRLAHKIRYETYSNKYDLAAYNFMEGQSAEAKKAICSANGSKSKGRKLTKEHREKLSRPGSLNSFYGQTHSVASKQKMRQKATERKWKEEAKEKLSETLRNSPETTGSRRCKIEGNVYRSCAKAASSLGLKRATLKYRLDSKNYEEYIWLDPPKTTKVNHQSLQVLVNGIEYHSVSYAATQLSLHPKTVFRRCENPAYQNYKFL